MKSIVRKTKDNSGATIIMALLFMLVCVMISVVLIAQAGSVAGSIPAQREQQKAYLAVSSAVDLLKNDIENYRFDKELGADSLEMISDGSDAIKPLLEATLTGYKQGSFLLNCEPYNDLKVKVDYELNMKGSDGKETKNYRIVLTCSSEAKESGKPLYSMKAKFIARSDETKDSYSKWVLSSISKG